MMTVGEFEGVVTLIRLEAALGLVQGVTYPRVLRHEQEAL
jgi:hypothetical protein